MNGRNNGFTLIELLIVLAIIGLVLAGTTQMVVSMLRANAQQSKISETNIEGIIGLNLLRLDLEKAGYGLPWNGLISYNEVASSAAAPAPSLNDAPYNPPKAVVSRDAGGWNGTDYLVIKASNVATNSACSKWTFVSPLNSSPTWSSSNPSSDNLASTDRVIILAPGSISTETTARMLATSGSSFAAQFGSVAAASLASTMTLTGVAYGIDANTDLRMPFNRADYYVRRPSSGMPQRCAAGTGILYKAVVKQADGTLNEMPLLDCVADMQVVFRYDPNGSGSASLTPINDLTTWTAQTIRDQVKEARIYILAHEGQRDNTFTYPTNPVYVGGDPTIGSSSGRSFDFAANGITNWQNYRWRIYTLVVKLDNLL